MREPEYKDSSNRNHHFPHPSHHGGDYTSLRSGNRMPRRQISARKEIGYDAASGRFFETDIDTEDCIPGNEYCVIDKDSGSMVRLTMEEKERIFLDALQVSAFGDVDFTWVTQ